jgi:hypothetical protein
VTFSYDTTQSQTVATPSESFPVSKPPQIGRANSPNAGRSFEFPVTQAAQAQLEHFLLIDKQSAAHFPNIFGTETPAGSAASDI